MRQTNTAALTAPDRRQNKIAAWTKYQEDSRQLLELEPLEIARRLPRGTCQYCGSLIIPRIETVNVMGRDRQVIRFPERHNCQAEIVALDGQAAAQAAAEQIQADYEYSSRLTTAGLTGWLREATLDSFAGRSDWPEAVAIRNRIQGYVEGLLTDSLGRKNWLVLYGGYGTGKSHLAAAVVRQAVDDGWNGCAFRVWTDYLLRIQNTYRNDPEGETEADVVSELQAGRLVVIDDLDKRRPTDFTLRSLFAVLNHRYNAGLPTILTFNYGPGDRDPKAPGRLALEEYLGSAVLDRVLGAAYGFIEFTGPSYRSGIALKTAKLA